MRWGDHADPLPYRRFWGAGGNEPGMGAGHYTAIVMD